MGCERHGNTIVCSRGGRRGGLGLCPFCRMAEATLLCDGPLPEGILHRRSSVPGASTTCSAPICRRCANHRPGESETDFCPNCWPKVNTDTAGATAL